MSGVLSVIFLGFGTVAVDFLSINYMQVPVNLQSLDTRTVPQQKSVIEMKRDARQRQLMKNKSWRFIYRHQPFTHSAIIILSSTLFHRRYSQTHDDSYNVTIMWVPWSEKKWVPGQPTVRSGRPCVISSEIYIIYDTHPMFIF